VQGIRNVRDTLKRAEAFKEMAGRFGVTLGQYDIVATVEGPDDLSATALNLALSAMSILKGLLDP
jgi:uncharacterized protein with GYD domain